MAVITIRDVALVLMANR